MPRRFCSLETACTVIFDRLGLESKLPLNAAWREHLLPALQDGLLTAEGRLVEYLPTGTEEDEGGRAWRALEPFERGPLAHLPRDWWIDAAPDRVGGGTVLRLVRDLGTERTEAAELIQLRVEDIDQLWPLGSMPAAPPADLYAAHRAVVFESVQRRTKGEAQAAAKAILGGKYSKKNFEDAWRELPASRKFCRGERRRQTSP